MTQLYPQLRHLRVDSPNISLEPLVSCTRLRTLRITGYSQTPAARAALVFEGMAELAGLQIVSRRRQSHYFRCQDLKKSVNSTTVRHMRPLQTMSIHDVTDVDSQRPAFSTINMFESIRHAHSASLRQFCVSCIAPLELPLLVQLAETISAMTQVHTLVLTWPGLEAELLEALPPSIWSLELLVSGHDHASDVLAVLSAMRQRIPRLRKIKFVVPDVLFQSDMAKLLPTKSGSRMSDPSVPESEAEQPWAVTWGLWCPFPED